MIKKLLSIGIIVVLLGILQIPAFAEGSNETQRKIFFTEVSGEVEGEFESFCMNWKSCGKMRIP